MTTTVRRTTTRVAAALLTMLLGVLSGLAGGPLAVADGTAGKLLLVLDSSGSMAEPAGDGGTRIEAARSALDSVVDQLPEDAQVGMRVYGATVFDREDEGACTDTQLVVPIGSGNKDALSEQIEQYEPYGETPIAYSLEQAAADVGTEGQRTILLVSDGEETCVPDPCPVAQKIADAGIDLKIDVVGLDVSGKAEEQLRCIAEKGNGDYYPADSTEDLERSLSKLSTRAFRPFRLTGTPVTGTEQPTSAPELGEGDWVDELPAEPETPAYYRLTRSQPGSTFWVGANLQSPVETSALELTILPASDPSRECGTEQAFSHGGSGLARRLLAGTVTSASFDEVCQEATELLLAVSVPADSDDVGGTPFQLRVHEEPPVEDSATLPEGAGDPTWEEMTPTDPTPVVPGTSFADAPVVEPGTYRTDIVPGELLVLQVEADWGQRVQVAAQTDPLGAADDWLARNPRPWGVDLIGPYGAPAAAALVSGNPPQPSSVITPDGGQVGASSKEVRHANRELDSDLGSAIDGSFYAVIWLDRQAEDQPYALPVTITLDVLGEPTGAPTYQQGEQPAPETSPSAGPTSSTPPTTSPAPTPGPEATAQTTPADAVDEGPSTPLVIGLGTAVVALGGAGAGTLWWLRRH